MSRTDTIPELGVPLERDLFVRRLLRELAGTLEDVVGLAEAEGFVALVGQRMAVWLDPAYREAYGVERLDPGQLAEALVDLKRRIEGGFSVEELNPERIVLANTACPFGDMVIGRPSLCQMTTNVFGTMVAENHGYARVRIDRAIARGDRGCRVIIDLSPTHDPKAATGDEFFKSPVQ